MLRNLAQAFLDISECLALCAHSLIFPAFFILLSSLIASVFYLAGQNREAMRLNESVKSLLHGGEIKSLNFPRPFYREIWQRITLLVSASRAASSLLPRYEEVLETTSCLLNSFVESQNLARKAITLLLQQCAPHAVACALVRLHADSVFIEAVTGITSQRFLSVLEAFLLSRGDYVGGLEGSYLTADETQFGVFGIGLSLIIPLPSGKDHSRILMVALGKNTPPLDHGMKTFIEKLAAHVGAALTFCERLNREITKQHKNKDELLAISHDIRSPGHVALFAIRSVLNDSAEISEETRARLTDVEQVLVEQNESISSVVDYARYRQGKSIAIRSDVSVQQTLKQLFSRFEHAARSKGLGLRLVESDDVLVICDPSHLRRMLSNILVNAINYTASGYIEVNHEVVSSMCEISVADMGHGIQSHEIELLFRPHTRLRSSGGVKGIGLGLAITRALADLNDGYVFYRPNSLGGSTFGIGLEALRGPKPNVLPGAKEKLGSILVVDDDPLACRALVRQLSNRAVAVHCALNLEQAVSIAEAHKPKVVLTDLLIGQESAEDLLLSLRGKGVLQRSVIMTGSSDFRRKEALQRNFSADLLEKPFCLEELLFALEERPTICSASPTSPTGL